MPDNIKFDEYKIKSSTVFGQNESPKMIMYLINKGFVKNEKQASVFLTLLISIFIFSSVFVIYSNFFKSESVAPMTVEQQILINEITGKK